MASPFSIFRKHQRAMMAVLGIMCMFAFTFTGFVGGLDSFTGGGNRQNPIAVTTNFGDFRESDIQLMRQKRLLARAFLVQAILQTFDEQIRRPAEPMLAQVVDTQFFFGPSTDSALLESRVLAHEAKQAGVVFNDESITEAVQTLCRGAWFAILRAPPPAELTNAQLQTALRSLPHTGIPATKLSVYDALRTELLAGQMRQVFATGLQPTPAQRWDYYQRLKRRMRVELAPLAAADFVPKVPNPSDDDARKFFDQYKDQEPQPGSPDPGFKIPHRAAFQYFEAHYQDFYHPEEITEAEITAHYEKVKDSQYLYNALSAPSDEDEEEPAADKSDAHKSGENKPADQQPDANKPAEKAPADKTPADKPAADKQPEGQPPSGKQPEADSKDEPNSSGSSCGSNGVDEEKADDEEEDEEAKALAGDDKQPAADDDDKPSVAEKTAEPAAGDSKAAAPGLSPPQNAPAGGEPGAKTGDESKPDDAKAAGQESKPAESGPKLNTKKSTAPPLSDRYVLPSDITKGPNPKYEPLWQAEPKIRKALAGAKAVEQMDKALLSLKGKLRPYYDSVVSWESRKEQNPNAPRPTAPDFESLVKDQRGVTFGRIPLSPSYQIAQVPGIGSSQVSGQPFVAFAVTGLRLFQAVESQDNDGNHYLFWKTDDQDARVPPFADAREEVVRVWKLREARRPMLEKADELAKLARQSGKSLKDTLAGQAGIEVTETPPFSWLTGGSAGQFGQRAPLRLGEVPGTIDIDNHFMQSVFDLQVGEVGVAENHPQSMAYVVRATTSEPPQAVLRDMFLADRPDTYRPVILEANGEIYQQWLRDQLAAAKVHWVRQPYDDMRSE